MTRVVAAGLLAGSLAGAVALRPTPTPATSTARPAAAAAARSQPAAALDASRAAAVRRHQAYVRSRSTQVAARQTPRRAQHVTARPRRSAAALVVRTAASPTARGQRIYAALHFDVRALGYRMVIRPGTAGLLGLTDARTRTVTVYVRSTESDLVVAHSIAHEIGHAVDFTRGSGARRALYLLIRHLPDQAWFGCNSCTDYATPAGDWAEVFAQWLAGRGDFRSRMAGAPTAAQLMLLTPLFAL